MADDFKTFDKAPIVGVVNIKHWSFAAREIILAFICLVMLVLCLIFAGLYAQSKGDSVEQALSPAAVVQKQFCITRECMKAASRSLQLINTSVDPCDNFYEYACGNYKSFNPTTRQSSRSVIADLQSLNEDRLEEIITGPPTRFNQMSYESKLHDFYDSCRNTYAREQLKGTPFLEKVVTELGGWQLIGTWDESQWSLNTMLQKVQTNFWVDAFYMPSVMPDAADVSQRVITLSPAGLGKWMYTSWYTSTRDYTKHYKEDYQKFIRRVGGLFLRDANLVNVTEAEKTERLDQFVNDTFFMETKIAEVIQASRYGIDPYKDENKVSLQNLNRETNNAIDWTSQMSYMFNEAGVTSSTRVVLVKKEYFKKLTDMIEALPAGDKKRLLHNYLIWRVAEVYIQDMSWEYIHANREIFVDTRGYPNFSGIQMYCLSLVRYYMADALGALYVESHLVEESKQKITDVTMNLKKALQTQLDKTPWMDDATKKYAKEKLDTVKFKLGYPDWMMDHEHVDNIYYPLDIAYHDLFGNILNANQYTRRQWNKLLRFGEDRERWIWQPYETTIRLYDYWNEIAAPAGILQDPIFNHNDPEFVKFGSIGGFLAKFLHYIVDEHGAYHDKNGDIMGDSSWWSNKSLTGYQTVRKCVTNAYRNITQNITLGGNFDEIPIPINAQSYTPTAIAATNGIRLALIGYHDWMQAKGSMEKSLPGLTLTPDQMVFLSYAQSHCFNRNDFEMNIRAIRGKVGEDIQVNMALGQLQEFTDTFRCSEKSKMNHKKKCDYY